MMLFIFFFAFFSFTVSAEIIPILVTAPRTSEFKTVRVIKKSEIASSPYQNVGDLLKQETSIDVAKEGLSGQTSIFFRGGESSHILVLLDGQEVNDPSDPTRRFNFNTIELDQIERIEIIRGARSVQFGSDALAGVINIVTRKSKDQKNNKVGLSAGSFSTYESKAFLNRVFNNQSKINLTATHSQSQGYSAAKAENADNDKVTRNYANLTFDHVFMNQIDLKYNFTLQELKQELDGGAGIDDPNARLGSRFFSQNLNLSKQINHQLSIYFKLGRNHYRRDFSDLKDERNTYSSENITRGSSDLLDFYFKFNSGEKHQTYLGTKYQKDQINIESQAASERLSKTHFSQTGYYLIHEYTLTQHKLSVGGRYDNNNYRSGIYNGRIGFESEHEHLFNYFGSLGTGYKTPTLYQLNSNPYGSKNLKPEESISFDLGYKLDFENMRWQQSYFQNDFKNLIQFNSTRTSENYENSKKAQVRGVEQSVELNFIENFKLRTNYTYMRAVDESLKRPLPLRSRHKASTDLIHLISESVNQQISMTMIGKRLNSSSSEKVNAGYGIISYGLMMKLKKIDVKFKLENIFDKDYVEMDGYNTSGRAISSGIEYLF